MHVWVAARDLGDDDNIKWTTYDESIQSSFWMRYGHHDEPEHTNGDCVHLDTNMKGLGMKDCGVILYYLCQVYIYV